MSQSKEKATEDQHRDPQHRKKQRVTFQQALARVRQQVIAAKTKPPKQRAATRAASSISSENGESDEDSEYTANEEEIADASEKRTATPSAGSASAAGNRSDLRSLKEQIRHFSKICNGFKFEAKVVSYQSWCVQIKEQLDLDELRDVIDTDPALFDEGDELQSLRQKTVYHMLLYCVPNAHIRAVVTTALPADEHTGFHADEHTGFHAWRALETHFIGDKKAYLQSIEDRWENVELGKEESFATFEVEFTSLVSELSLAGVEKLPHQKRARIMLAIRCSRRRDAQGADMFTRLNVTNQINEKRDFQKWLIAIRVEAQKIHDEFHKRG